MPLSFVVTPSATRLSHTAHLLLIKHALGVFNDTAAEQRRLDLPSLARRRCTLVQAQ